MRCLHPKHNWARTKTSRAFFRMGDGSRPLADFDREGGSTIRCTHIIQHRSDALFLTTCIGEGLDETLLCPSWETG